MTICYFGYYDPDYARNRVLISGLRKNGVKVIECNDRSRSFLKYIRLVVKYWQIEEKTQTFVVGFSSPFAVLMAKIISPLKPVVFDAFTSLYESNVIDRKLYGKNSLTAKFYWLVDWLSCKLADVVLLDTAEHIKYFVQEFGINESKCRRIFVGTDNGIFNPMRNEIIYGVHWHGTGVPLQGMEYVVSAAEALKMKNVSVNIIDGSPWLSLEELAETISKSSVCLGIFGTTDKTARVIPNKLFECVAMKKPVITADTPAIRELFNGDEIMMIGAGDSHAIANAVLKLIDDNDLRHRLAENAYNKFINLCTPIILGNQLKEIAYGLV